MKVTTTRDQLLPVPGMIIGGIGGAAIAPQDNWWIIAEAAVFVIAILACPWIVKQMLTNPVPPVLTMLAIAWGSASAILATSGVERPFSAGIPVAVYGVICWMFHFTRPS